MDNITAFRVETIFLLNNQTFNASIIKNGGKVDSMSSEGFTVITLSMFLIFILGLSENSFSLYVFFHTKSLWTTNNIFIAGLLLSDWSQSVFGIPLVVASSVAREWIFGHGLCVYYGFITTFLGLTQITTLTAISLDKYFVIVRKAQIAILEKKKAVVIILLCYLYGFLWALAPVLGWSSYTLEAVNISCSIPWQSEEISDVSYCLALTVFVWILPLGAIVFSYSSICVRIRKESRKPIGRKLKKSSQKKKQMSREKSVAITVLIMIGAFVVSWMPYSIVSLITVFGDPSTIPLPVTTIPALFAKSSIIWNPIIYVARHNDFRRACLKFLPECCICKKIRQYDMANGPSTTRNLTEQILLEALTKIRNSRKPHNRLNQQYASSIISMDSTTMNRNLIRKTTPLTVKKQRNGSEIESEGNSGDFESCSSYENERLRIFDKNVTDFAKRILTSLENQSEESSIAIELDRQSEKNLDLEKERKPLLVNKTTRNECINVCASTMTDVGIQTSLDDSVSGNIQGNGFQTNVFFVKRKHECKHSDKACESVQIDNMDDGILLKDVDTKGAYSNERYHKDCSLTDSKLCASNQNNCGLTNSTKCNQAADSQALIAQSEESKLK